MAATKKYGLYTRNPQLDAFETQTDFLYHLGLDSSMDLQAMFGDVKFVLMGGSADRAHTMALRVQQELKIKLPTGCAIAPVGKTERYFMYKVGPVICVNHGMGMPSLSILLHELAKLLTLAGAKDVIFTRIGTCGGVGVAPGTVVLTEEAINGSLRPYHTVWVLGKQVDRPTTADPALLSEILACKGDIPVVVGKTMSTDDFYEGQGRTDGALCDYTPEDKMAFLHRLHELGVRNIEMEAACFAAFCRSTGIRGAVACAAILNRLEGDQVTSTHEQLASYQERAIDLMLNFVKCRLGMCDKN